MEDNEEYDSDSTVLLTDFVDKPQKIDAKRRRLSHLEDRSKQSNQLIENNAAPNDVSENIQTGEENRDWRLTKYFSCNNDNNDTNLRNDIPHFRSNEEKVLQDASDCQTLPGNISKANTDKFDNKDDIVCLDSDDEMQSDEITENIDSLINDRVHRSKLIVLKPAAINARRATVDFIGENKIHSKTDVQQRQEELKPDRIRVLKPHVINERRATTHFEENNLELSLTNENENNLKKGNKESGKEKQAENYSVRMTTPRLSDLHSAVASTISDTRAGSDDTTSVCVGTQGVISTVSRNPLNTIICHNTTSEGLLQDTMSNDTTISNVKANKRYGNIESELEPKRIKANMNQKLIVLPSEEDNENSKESQGKEAKGEEHVKRPLHKVMREILYPKSRDHNKSKSIVGSPLAASVTQELTYVHEKTRGSPAPLLSHLESPTSARGYGTLENNSTYEKEMLNSWTFNKKCKDKDTNLANVVHQDGVSIFQQDTRKAQAEEVITERYDERKNTAILNEQTTNRPPSNLETKTSKVQDIQKASADQLDKNDTSKMQEDEGAHKGPDNTQDAVVSEVQDQQKVHKTFDRRETSLTQNGTISNNEHHSGDDGEKTITCGANEEQDTSNVLSDIEGSEVEIDQVTTKVQEEQVTSNNILLETTFDEQETIHVQGELETRNNRENQIPNVAVENQETENVQDNQITSERIETEDVSNEKCKNVTSIAPEQDTRKENSEKITSESKSCNEQVTDQQNIANGGSLNACVVDSELMLKFQHWFFTKIIENLTEMDNNSMETNLESAIMLKNIIKSLIDAKNRTDQADVEYSCPKCGCVSHYSSSLADNTECDRSNPTANIFQNCGFCCYIRKLHITYLKRYLNKKDRNVNNQEATNNILRETAERCKSSKPEIASSHSKRQPKENTCNDVASSSEAKGSISNLSVENEKQIDNLTLTQSCSDTKTVNLNVSNDNNIVNEAPCIRTHIITSKRDIISSCDENNSEILVGSNETNKNDVTVKELSNQDTSIAQNCESTGEINLTGSHVNEVVSILNNLAISYKRTNTDEQDISHKRMKTAAENNINTNKSDNTPNDTTNENAIELSSQNVFRLEGKENYKRINKTSVQSDKETIMKSNESITQSQTSNTEEINNDNESVVKSLVECFSQLKYITKEGKDNLVVTYKYTCPHCPSMYTHASKLLRHLKNTHYSELTKIPEKSIKLQCPFCKKLLFKNYNKHVVRCRVNVLKRSKSKKDNYNSYGSNENKDNINDKNIISRRTSELKYYCAVCDTTLFTDYYAARQHRQQIHPELKHRHIIKRTKVGDKLDKQNESKIKRSDETQTSKPHDVLRTSAALDTEKDDDEYSSTDEFYQLTTSSESEDDALSSISRTDISSQNTSNSDQSWKPSTNQDVSCNEDKDNCDSDERSIDSYELHDTSETSGGDNYDKNNTKTMNASKEGTTTDSNGYYGAGNRRKYIYKCLICKTMLYSDYAIRKHRANQHPKMRGVPIFNKFKGEPDGNECKPNKLNREKSKTLLDNASSPTDSVAEVEQGNNKNNETLSRRRCKDNISDDTSDSDWSTASNLDCTDARQCTVNADIETSSENCSLDSCSEEETAHEGKDLKKSEYDNEASVRKSIHDSYQEGRHKKRRNVHQKQIKHSSIGKERSNAKRRKRVIEDSSDSDWIISTDESADSFREMKDSGICDSKNINTDKSNDGRYLTIDKEVIPGSDDETIKSSTYTVRKKRERLSMVFGNEKDSDGEDGKKREISTENVNKSLRIGNHTDYHCDNNNRNPLRCDNEVLIDGSDDETIKVSKYTIKKRNKRISTMFDEGNHLERNDALKQSSNHGRNIGNSGSKGEISKNNENRYETPSERSEWKNGEYNPGQCEEVPNQKAQNKETCCITSEDCDMDPATDHNKITKDSEGSNTSASTNANAILNHDDRREIDLIDGLLEEYNSQNPEDQRIISRIEKEKNGKCDREPNINDAQSSEVNIVSQASLPSDKMTNCFENIQITNVRSVANKLLIFICQECSFATDTYDDTIRHCQNHYNHIVDPINYCNICQVKYGISCFNRHQTWHDKYLITIKIMFSFRSLFLNWSTVFKNKNILLREAEEIQVKSIYKTHCIKMSVKEAGPWQSALYLCAKCNICISPQDIEKHVQNICTSKSYPCTLCGHAFLTHEMREHHEIYHEGDITQQFKTIVFNEEQDESFNLKLIQAKSAIVTQKQQNVDIYKCMCGLCFISLKKFKLHFVDCGSQTNNGVKCSGCSGERRFLPTDLEEHFSFHHSVTKYAFRVQQITFKQEYDSDSLEQESKVILKSTENTTQTRSNDADININKDMLEQDDSNTVKENLAVISSAENAVQPISIDKILNVDRQILKDEPLSQHTNGENTQQDINIVEGNLDKRYTVQNEAQLSNDKELTSKRNLLKEEQLSQSINRVYGQDMNVVVVDTNNITENVTQVMRNEEDMRIKKEMIKYESISQNSSKENMQEYVRENLEHKRTEVKDQEQRKNHTAIDKDISVKRDMLKKESLSQDTIEENMFEGNLETSTVEDEALFATNKDLNIKRDMLKDKSLSQGNIDENMQGKADTSEVVSETSTAESLAKIATNEDLNIKKDMLKDESLSQATIEDNVQEEVDAFEGNLEPSTVESLALNATDEDLYIKRDMLKDESLSQNSVEECTQEDIVTECLVTSLAENATEIVAIDEDFNDITDTNYKGKNSDKQHLQLEHEVFQSNDCDTRTIIIEDSDDDVELIEEGTNEFKFARRRAF